MAKLLLVIVGVAALVAAGQAAGGSTDQLQRLIAEEQSKCASGQDSMACIKERAMRFVDNMMSKDSYKVSLGIINKSVGLIAKRIEVFLIFFNIILTILFLLPKVYIPFWILDNIKSKLNFRIQLFYIS